MMSIAEEILKPTLSGDEVVPIKRLVTGLHSFDRALGNVAGDIGMPLGAGYELMGRQGAGKTTFGYSMLGFLGKHLETDVSLISFEDYDGQMLMDMMEAQGFTRDIRVISSGTDEEMLYRWLDVLRPVGGKETPRKVAMLDSIAAISPASEQGGELGMGFNTGRAIVMSQLSKRILPVMAGRNPGSDYVVFYTNHYYKKPDGTWGSPGGNVKEYLCRVRIRLKKVPSGGSFKDGYILEGNINKNNYGYENKKFHVFIRYGHGIHHGLTALVDAVNAKLAKKEKNTTMIKMGDEKFGRMNHIVTEKYNDPDFFQPFYDVLGDKNENT